MAGCGNEIEVYVEKGFTHVPVKTRCGSTGQYGYPNFCEKCEKLYADRDWRREAFENGEAWDEDDY